MRQQLQIKNLSCIQDVARQFLSLTKGYKKIAFKGDMGAGKTTFIKTLCTELGVADVVTSPTFAIVNVYKSSKEGLIYHMDCYRIRNIQEIYDIGYEEYFFDNQYCFIEWPEMIEDIIPENFLKVNITIEPDSSRLIDIG